MVCSLRSSVHCTGSLCRHTEDEGENELLTHPEREVSHPATELKVQGKLWQTFGSQHLDKFEEDFSGVGENERHLQRGNSPVLNC